jgi:hypothetical protein
VAVIEIDPALSGILIGCQYSQTYSIIVIPAGEPVSSQFYSSLFFFGFWIRFLQRGAFLCLDERKVPKRKLPLLGTM